LVLVLILILQLWSWSWSYTFGLDLGLRLTILNFGLGLVLTFWSCFHHCSSVTWEFTLTPTWWCGHVQRTVSRCFAALRQLRQIRRAMPQSTFQSLVATGLWKRRAGLSGTLSTVGTECSSSFINKVDTIVHFDNTPFWISAYTN